MNRFVLKNTFIKIYIYHFSINIFIEIRSQSCLQVWRRVQRGEVLTQRQRGETHMCVCAAGGYIRVPLFCLEIY